MTKGTRTAIILWRLKFATVAQLVEQRIRNAQVVGSSPTSSSILKKLAVIKQPVFLLYIQRFGPISTTVISGGLLILGIHHLLLPSPFEIIMEEPFFV